MPPKEKEETEFFRFKFAPWDLINVLRMLKNFETRRIIIEHHEDYWEVSFDVVKPEPVLHIQGE